MRSHPAPTGSPRLPRAPAGPAPEQRVEANADAAARVRLARNCEACSRFAGPADAARACAVAKIARPRHREPSRRQRLERRAGEAARG